MIEYLAIYLEQIISSYAYGMNDDIYLGTQYIQFGEGEESTINDKL
jgi:hypothetical protein